MRDSAAYKRYASNDAIQHDAQIPFIISMPTNVRNADGKARTIKLAGHTRSVGLEGLELVGPFIRFGNRSLMNRDNTFQVVLGLPSGAVRVRVAAVSYAELDEDETGVGYLMAVNHETVESTTEMRCVIKVRVISIHESDRARFSQYLKSLGKGESEQTVMVMERNGSWRPQTLTVTVLA